MKFFAPILFASAAVALGSSNFTLSVKGGTVPSSLGTAKRISQSATTWSVGFINDNNLQDAVLSLDDNGYLEEGFLLRLVNDQVWTLMVESNIRQQDDITGPFEVDNTTRELRYNYWPDSQWSFCPGRGSDEVVEIQRTGESVDVSHCSSAHQLITTPWTASSR
ncbi:hypothetical protein B0J18DRAFT_469727 [Chaetomium sp. MPI-SDFR-AT-0129]|nr:hypothetical protein B0J18DRAFT_469727 [Chaetomium sp. MPI-SDFR-AT-0129]